MLNKLKMLSVILAVVALTGCASMMPGNQGSQGGVSILDENTRAHLIMADSATFAETVTNKMLSSRFVQSWGTKRPKLVFVTPRNSTGYENIRMAVVLDRASEVILNSGIARLMDKSALEIDYLVRFEMASTRQYGDDGEELAFFKIEFKMFSVEGKMVGQWSAIWSYRIFVHEGIKKWGRRQ